MGHVNPAVCQPRKESWRWETTNSEYGKFYVRKLQREVVKGQDDCSKKCEELTNELLEAKAQLEKLKISCARNICRPAGLQDTACQTSPTSPGRLPSRKLYSTQKTNQYNMLEGNDTQMLLDHEKEDYSHLVKRVKPKLPLLKLRNGRNNQGDCDDHDNRDMECCKSKMPSGCGLLCGGSGSGSHSSISSGSAKGHGPPSAGKRKILQKQGGPPKKQKGPMVKATSNLKHTAGGGANLPPSQRYTFYRNFGYGDKVPKQVKAGTQRHLPGCQRDPLV